MNENRLPRAAYKTMCRLDTNGEKTWATNVRQFLNTHGFSFVWDNGGVQCISSFLKCFKQRLIDCRWQNWHEHVYASDRFVQYRLFKTTNGIEPYVNIQMHRYIKSALTKFRLGISNIACHRLRYKDTDDFMCRLCNSDKEDDIHFLLCCPALHDLRVKFIHRKYYDNPCSFKFSILMSSRNESTLRTLAMYVYEALKRLDIATS